MKRGVIYARTAHPSVEAIKKQLEAGRRFAKENEIEIVKEYIDDGFSGINNKRPDFQKMIAEAPSIGYDFVIVFNLDRFARNRYDSALYSKKLRESSAKVISTMEKLSDKPESMILETLLEGMSEYCKQYAEEHPEEGFTENVLGEAATY